MLEPSSIGPLLSSLGWGKLRDLILRARQHFSSLDRHHPGPRETTETLSLRFSLSPSFLSPSIHPAVLSTLCPRGLLPLFPKKTSIIGAPTVGVLTVPGFSSSSPILTSKSGCLLTTILALVLVLGLLRLRPGRVPHSRQTHDQSDPRELSISTPSGLLCPSQTRRYLIPDRLLVTLPLPSQFSHFQRSKR